jgi:hypothetical protein
LTIENIDIQATIDKAQALIKDDKQMSAATVQIAASHHQAIHSGNGNPGKREKRKPVVKMDAPGSP